MSIGAKIRAGMMVRKADPTKEPVKECLAANSKRNAFDPDVLEYPLTTTLAAHSNGTTYAYMPVNPVLMLESIGMTNGHTPQEQANAVMEMTKTAAALGHINGYREVYFLASDETTANGAKLMGFEELPYKCFRLKLK